MKLKPAGLVLLLAALTPAASGAQQPTSASYLYVWTGDADTLDSDFLAVIDVRPGSPTYAQVLSTVPVGARATRPHHTEHQLERDHLLVANGFGAGRTFRFDLSHADRPRLLGSFTDVGGFSYPHSFVQRANGHLLATFQGHAPGRTPPGGLVELDRRGRLIRATSARAAQVDSLQLRPYRLAILPGIDRVVSTSTDMIEDYGAHLQIWKLSTLELLQTIELPSAAPQDHDHAMASDTMPMDHHRFPGEPRVLSDGRTVLLATFTCGFYRVTMIDTPAPRVDFLRAFAGADCAVPVLVGSVWVQTVPDEHALVSLDVSDSDNPRELDRVTFDSTFRPHWMAFDAGGSRLVVDDARERLFLVNLDQRTGHLSIDADFRDPNAASAGVTFNRTPWPHGATGAALPHGAVFSRP